MNEGKVINSVQRLFTLSCEPVEQSKGKRALQDED